MTTNPETAGVGPVAYCNKCGHYGPVDEYGRHLRPRDGMQCNYVASAHPAPASNTTSVGEGPLAELADLLDYFADPSDEEVERVTDAVQKEARVNGADSPVDRGDAEQIARAALAAIRSGSV